MFGFGGKQKGNVEKEIGMDTAKNKLKVIKIQTLNVFIISFFNYFLLLFLELHLTSVPKRTF